jgi:hypothetical protein
MAAFAKLFAEIFRDYSTDGVPSSGANKPNKADIRAWGLEVETHWTHGADIVAAATVNLDTATGELVDITGNTGISAVTLSEGVERWVRFTGTPLITVGGSLVGNGGGSNIQVAAGDYAVFRGYAASVVRFVLFRASGKPVVPNAYTDLTFPAGFPYDTAGRLTLTSGTPVTTGDVTAATSVYFTPLNGAIISLYDGASIWTPVAFSETTLSLSGLAANTNFDVFGYNNSGTLALEALAWSSDTARATALVLQNGVYVKTGATTRRYLGTFRTTGTIGQTEDSKAKRFLWNAYNRRRRLLSVVDTTDSWTYTTATWRQANGAAGNQVAMVVGLSEDVVTAVAAGIATNSSGGMSVASGVGVNATNANSAQTMGGGGHTAAAGNTQSQARYLGYLAVGYNFLAWLEISQATGTTTWYGDGGLSYIQSGLTAECMA